jgi:hypothetical protein
LSHKKEFARRSAALELTIANIFRAWARKSSFFIIATRLNNTRFENKVVKVLRLASATKDPLAACEHGVRTPPALCLYTELIIRGQKRQFAGEFI